MIALKENVSLLETSNRKLGKSMRGAQAVQQP